MRSTDLPVRRALASLAAVAVVGATAAAPAPAAEIADGPANLTRTYRGDDGSALYTRGVGTKVVGFGEDAAGKQAFVFEGTRSATTISGRFWDVAKGARTRTGNLKLTFSSGGSLLKRNGGDDLGAEIWQAKPAAGMIWPKAREAVFQNFNGNDLDGAFAGNDGSRAYVRETSTELVWLAEQFPTSQSKRPGYATVAIGKRTPNGFVSASFYDIPKGTQPLRHGSVIGTSGSRPRTFSQTLHDFASNSTLTRAKSYAADYAIDLDRFEQEINDRLAPFVVGYGYAIAADNKVVRQGGGGSRRIPQPDNGVTDALPFTPFTVNEIASATKTVTAVAVGRALLQRKISLDAKVNPYLPAQWTRGPGMTTVTFRQLLAHGGLKHPGAVCDDDPYECLRQAVALGMVGLPGDYDNIHYTIMRVILPFVTDSAAMQTLFATQTDTSEVNEVFSAEFRDEIQATLLAASVNADFDYPATGDIAYRYSWGPPANGEIGPEGSESDYLEAGSGGLKMTPVQYAQFLTRLENGWIVPATLVQEIKLLGFGQTSHPSGNIGNGIGPLYGKAGGAGGTGTYGMVFPGNVQVFISRNSTGNAAQTDDRFMLRAAWQAALVQ